MPQALGLQAPTSVPGLYGAGNQAEVLVHARQAPHPLNQSQTFFRLINVLTYIHNMVGTMDEAVLFW